MDRIIGKPGVTFCTFEKNTTILEQGQILDSLFYLTKGTVYRSIITEKGDELIYSVRTADHTVRSLLGVLVFYGTGVNNSNFITKTRCQGYQVPRQTYFDFIRDKPDLLQDIISLALGEYYSVQHNFQARQEGKAANRICQLMLQHIVINQGQLVISKELSNVLMARMLGIHKVTVSRVMKALKDQRIIQGNDQGFLVLSEERLREYANGKKIFYSCN